MIFNGLDPFCFKQGVRSKAIEDFELMEVVVVFRVELYRDKVSDYLIGSIFDVCSRS